MSPPSGSTPPCGWPPGRASEAQPDQRHVAAAVIDRGLQVRLALVSARLAPDQHAGIAGAQRRSKRRQIIGMRGRFPIGYTRRRKIQRGDNHRGGWPLLMPTP